MCSKILGIGCTEQSWKKVKKNMSRDWPRLSTVKAKMQANVVGIHMAGNNQEDYAKKTRAVVVWDDVNLETLSLDAHYLPLDVAPDDKIKKNLLMVTLDVICFV